MLAGAIANAILNIVLFVGIPFLFYWGWHRWRHGRRLPEIARRAGLQVGDPRYIGWCAILAVVSVLALVLFPPPIEPMIREGSAQHDFAGLGLTGTSLAMSLVYGILKTGFPEEFFFRGLIAGSLGRRLPLLWANLIQALVFLAPHVLVVLVIPELWAFLPILFVASLVLGWARIRGESILGPWLVHAAANVATCLSVAIRSAG